MSLIARSCDVAYLVDTGSAVTAFHPKGYVVKFVGQQLEPAAVTSPYFWHQSIPVKRRYIIQWLTSTKWAQYSSMSSTNDAGLAGRTAAKQARNENNLTAHNCATDCLDRTTD